MAAPSKYYAFISYSRKDSKAAAWLQRRLEWFRFPVKLVPEDRRPPNARYVRPIYRDKTSLEVTDEHYWTNIRHALEESRHLIVLCSPHAAASEPVNLEVAHFLATHGGDASLVVPIIVSGNVTSAGADAALCPALRALGDPLTTRNLPTMVPDAVTAEQDAWEHGFVSLVSYLLRLERTALGDHIQRETKRQARVLRRWLVAVGMLTVIAAASAWLAFKAKREVEKVNAVIVERNRAVEAANEAITKKNKEISDQIEVNRKNLHEASMADYSAAVQRIEKDGEWAKGVAYLVRALKLEPNNSLAAAWLYSTLAFHGQENWPRQVLRHESRVVSAQFSPDGRRIVTASPDKTARVWDATTGRPVGEPLRHEASVNSAEFSRDGQRIVTASDDKTARVWDAATGMPLGEPMRHEDKVEGAEFSEDGQRIVTVGASLGARVWVAATGKPIGKTITEGGLLNSAHFSPDGRRIVIASWDSARVWEAATGQPVGKPMRHADEVYSANFSPDGKRIVTASQDKTARVWDAATGKPLGKPLRHETGVLHAGFSPDGSRIITTSDDNAARVWLAESGELLSKPLWHTASVVAEFSPDGQRIVTASRDGTAQIWDATGKPLGDILPNESMPLGEPLRHEDFVNSAQFSPDGKRIVTACEDGTAQVWEAATGKPLGEPLRHEHWVFSAQFSPDGQRIVTASEGKSGIGEARVWELATGKPLGEAFRHARQLNSAQFSPDGRRIVTACEDGTARIWEAATGKPLSVPFHHDKEVCTAKFSFDGLRIVTASADGTARVWEAVTGKQLGEPIRHGGELGSAEFSPDGQSIVTACADGAARLWDFATGKLLSESFKHKNWVVSAQFSPDGRRIVTASLDYTARVWETATGKPLSESLKHEDRVHQAQFSPDGQYIVTASDDKTAQVWEATTGKCLGEPLRHEAEVRTAQFSPDGQRIVTASLFGTARIWDVSGILHLPTPVPTWILASANAVAGLGFDENGELQSITPQERRATLLNATPGNDPWSNLVRWLVTAAEERTLTPNSKFTCRQIAERERDSGFKEGIESALRYDPTVPLARILLAGALLREEAERVSLIPGLKRDPSLPQHAAFLRDYDLQRMPDDAGLWERAVLALHEQKDAERTRRALAKLETLDKDRAAAVRKELGL